MQITVRSRRGTVSKDIREMAVEKAARLERFFNRIDKIDVLLSVQGDRREAEMIVRPIRGREIVGVVVHDDMMAAIDLLLDKMERQLKRTKERRREKRTRQVAIRGGAEVVAVEAIEGDREGDDETYEEIIARLDLGK